MLPKPLFYQPSLISPVIPVVPACLSLSMSECVASSYSLDEKTSKELLQKNDKKQTCALYESLKML